MIRRMLFLIFFYFGVIFLCLVLLPGLVLNKNIVILGGKLLGKWSKFCLEVFLNTKISIEGKENIAKNKFFIACAHQSQFETFFLQTLFNSPIFILKKELFNVPIFGWYLRKMGCIGIERNKVTKENLNFFEKIKDHYKNSSRPIIIFPQATRVDINDRSPFKKGVKRIYSELNIICQPVALNSGLVWPKKGKMKSNKTLKISILEAIEPGKDPDEFFIKLQKNIYKEIDKMV